MAARQEGTRTVRLSSDLSPGETRQVKLAELTGGPKNRKGYLRQFLPFSAVVVDSYSASVRLRASIGGVNFDPVPTNSARTFDSQQIRSVWLKNPSDTTAVTADDIELILFNPHGEVAREEQAGTFSIGRALRDAIPGVR